MNEVVSTYAKCLIETLLNVHGLANMARGATTPNLQKEYMSTAAKWLPTLETQMNELRHWLEHEVNK